MHRTRMPRIRRVGGGVKSTDGLVRGMMSSPIPLAGAGKVEKKRRRARRERGRGGTLLRRICREQVSKWHMSIQENREISP